MNARTETTLSNREAAELIVDYPSWFLVGAEAEISALKNPKDACEFLRTAVAYLLLEDGAEQRGDDLRNDIQALFRRGRCFSCAETASSGGA